MDHVEKICGYTVHFPYSPYPSQRQIMEKLLTAVSSSEHALLESPTGTGKTLALLCGACAYQQHFKDKNDELDMLAQKKAQTKQPPKNGSPKVNVGDIEELVSQNMPQKSPEIEIGDGFFTAFVFPFQLFSHVYLSCYRFSSYKPPFHVNRF